MGEKQFNKKTIVKMIVSLLVIVGIMGALYLVAYLLGWTKISKEQLQEFLRSTGAIAPLVFVGITFLQVTFVPIPSAVTIVAGSWCFGLWQSYLYSYIGLIIGSLFAFFLGRIVGRPFVNWTFGSKEEADNYLKRLHGKEKIVLFFMFLLPAFPDDALCALAGLLPITWPQFIFMQLLTRLTSVGGTLLFMSGEIIPYNGWGLAIIIAVAILSVVAFVVCFKNAEKINTWFDNAMTKLSNKLKGRKSVAKPNAQQNEAPAQTNEKQSHGQDDETAYDTPKDNPVEQTDE